MGIETSFVGTMHGNYAAHHTQQVLLGCYRLGIDDVQVEALGKFAGRRVIILIAMLEIIIIQYQFPSMHWPGATAVEKSTATRFGIKLIGAVACRITE